MTTAFLFPGQGSQTVGMGKDFAERFPAAREIFNQADKILGISLSEMCFSGPEEDLNQTINTQPAVFTTGIATLRAIQSVNPEARYPYRAPSYRARFEEASAVIRM